MGGEWLDAWIVRNEAELVATRRQLHAHPEAGRREFETTRLLMERLSAAGLSPKALPGGAGLWCDIGEGPRVVALRADLEKVRRCGIAVNDEELDTALRSIAAPVRTRSGEVVAAVNLVFSWSPESMSELVSRRGPAVKATARQISARVI